MSSSHEGQPHDSRKIFAPVPARPWTKLIAAFAAGVACTFVFVTVASFSHNGSEPKPNKITQRAQGAKEMQQPKSTTPPSDAKSDTQAVTGGTKVVTAPSEPQNQNSEQISQSAAAPPSPATERPSDVAANEPPPADGSAGKPDAASRPVRVIPIDRNNDSNPAPTTSNKRTTNGSTKGDTKAPQPVVLTNEGKPVYHAGDKPRELAGGPNEQPRAGETPGAAPTEPKATARSEQAATKATEASTPTSANRPANEAANDHTAGPAANSRERREARRQMNERAPWQARNREDDRRAAERQVSDRQSVRAPEEEQRVPGAEEPRDEQARSSRDAADAARTGVREASRSQRSDRAPDVRRADRSARVSRDEETQSRAKEQRRFARNHAMPQEVADEGDAPSGRPARLPDSRRVIIYERAQREPIETRPPRPRIPFFSDLFGSDDD